MITIPDAMRRPAEVERDELRKQLEKAEAEIERLKIEVGDLLKESALQRHATGQSEADIEQLQSKNAKIIANRDSWAMKHGAACKLIEQMRWALVAAKNDGKMQSAITYQLIRTAISAAERLKNS